jgi:hypothetical protein
MIKLAVALIVIVIVLKFAFWISTCPGCGFVRSPDIDWCLCKDKKDG